MSNYGIKKSGVKKPGILTWLPVKIIQYSIFLYVLAMFLIFPFYYQDKFYDMGEAKFLFFKYATFSAFTVIMAAGVIAILFNFNRIKAGRMWRKLSVTDCFVIAYAIIVWISFALTPYKTDAIWGYKGWYMGLISQMAFVAIYFLVSRFLHWNKLLLNLICIASAIVFILAVMHRFQIDPLRLYEGLSMMNKILFLSTIGQATWYSSFLCVVFPIGLYLFWHSTNRKHRIFYALYVFVGFATMVTQNSDSAFIAFSLMLLVLFCFSFQSNNAFKHFLETLLIGLTACKLIGVLQVMFPGQVVPLEPLSVFVSQSGATWIIYLIVILGYIAFLWLEAKHKIVITKFHIIPRAACIAVAVIIPLSVFCVYLVSTDRAPAFMNFLKDVGYFNFNDVWGSNRGFTWRYSAAMFREYPFYMKLFGCGPDCFASYSYAMHSTELTAKFGNSILTNAHNEWFTSLLFFGIFGLVSYLGIFVAQAASCIKKAAKEPFLIAVAMCILAYIGHNFFCYQQIVCTPLIFIIMGMGEGRLRKIKVEGQDAL